MTQHALQQSVLSAMLYLLITLLREANGGGVHSGSDRSVKPAHNLRMPPGHAQISRHSHAITAQDAAQRGREQDGQAA